jgi:hypothetical protein
VGHLNELHDKYFEKGLRIVAISDEPLNKIKAVMVEELGARFWMGSDPGRETMAPFGGGGIPHAYLLDASGKVVADLHPGNLQESQIEELLAKAFDPALGRELHKSLAPLVKEYEKGAYGKAWSGAGRSAGAEDAALAADAAFLREKCEAAAAHRKQLAEGAIADKSYGDALDDLASIAKDFAGMEAATWAAAKQKELAQDPAIGNEIKAWEAYAKAGEKEREAEGKEKKLGPARNAYKAIVKKYPGTRAAELAQKALARLGG